MDRGKRKKGKTKKQSTEQNQKKKSSIFQHKIVLFSSKVLKMQNFIKLSFF